MKRAPRPRIAAALALLGSLALLAASCEDGGGQPQLPPQPCQPGSCPPGQWPTLPAPTPDPSPTVVTPQIMPAFLGFPCSTSEDIICGWGKCIAGRCGGCQSSNDCKVGGACGWTPIGMACMYGGSQAPR